MRLHSSGVASDLEDSLRKEQERRVEAEREVQKLKKRLSGELPGLTQIGLFHSCILTPAQYLHVHGSYNTL